MHKKFTGGNSLQVHAYITFAFFFYRQALPCCGKTVKHARTLIQRCVLFPSLARNLTSSNVHADAEHTDEA
jgi:hypothetical protein